MVFEIPPLIQPKYPGAADVTPFSVEPSALASDLFNTTSTNNIPDLTEEAFDLAIAPAGGPPPENAASSGTVLKSPKTLEALVQHLGTKFRRAQFLCRRYGIEFPSAFQLMQGGIAARSLDNRPGIEFGAKAHNLGMLYDSPLARMTSPGVALLQPQGAARTDRMDVLHEVVPWLEKKGKARFGASSGMPLLLAVRSSPAQSSPGIAKSVIYVGMNRDTVGDLARGLSPDVAHRTHAWFLRSFAKSMNPPESVAALLRRKPDGMAWEEYAGIILQTIGEFGIHIPEDPYEQLLKATDTVADSMESAGMAGGIIVQNAVVIDDNSLSGSGVYLTRSLRDGSSAGSARFASGGAGSEVVTGDAGAELPAGSSILAALDDVRRPLEKRYADAVEAEYAAVRGAIILLQAKQLAFPDPEVQIRVWEDMVRGGMLAAAKYPKRIFDLHSEVPADVKVVGDPSHLKDPVGSGIGINQLYAAQGTLVESTAALSQGGSKSPPILYVIDPNESSVLKAMWNRRIAGIVTPNGHGYSHLAILARLLKIPMLTGFRGDVSAIINSPVLIDEVTGSLYRMDEGTDSLLTSAPQTDAGNYLGVDLEEIQGEVLKTIIGYSIKACAKLHDTWVNKSIQAVKERDFEMAARWTFKAHFLHLEISKLTNKKDPFVVYAWDDIIPASIKEKYGKKYPGGIRAVLVNEAFNIDPTFRVLSKYYGDRLRLVVKSNTQGGQYTVTEFYRISAIVDGGNPFLMYKKFYTNDNHATGFVAGVVLDLFDKTAKSIAAARSEAKALAETIPGAMVVEYDLIHKYHDRGLLDGTKVIGVLPPLMAPERSSGGASSPHTASTL